jgi:hypothetical protein
MSENNEFGEGDGVSCKVKPSKIPGVAYVALCKNGGLRRRTYTKELSRHNLAKLCSRRGVSAFL